MDTLTRSACSTKALSPATAKDAPSESDNVVPVGEDDAEDEGAEVEDGAREKRRIDAEGLAEGDAGCE